jgi:CHAD domain-containing protein
MLSGGGRRIVKASLRRAGRTLGPARDLDVLARQLRDETETALSRSDAADIEERRKIAYAKLARKLDKRRFKRAILRLAVWIEAGQWLTVSSRKASKMRRMPVERLAKTRLQRRWIRIFRDVSHIEAFSPAKRHALRMRIKALRYGAEFFADAFGERRDRTNKKELKKTLETLQDVLGDMNDAAFRQEAFRADPAQRSERYAFEIQSLMPDALAAARRLRSLTPFWK